MKPQLRRIVYYVLGFVGGIVLAFASVTATYALSPTSVISQSLEIAIEQLPQAQQAYQTGRYEQARINWESAYAEFEQRGDLLQQISILNALCNTYQQLGDLNQAEVRMQRSLELLTQLDTNQPQELRLYAQTLNTQGKLSMAMGRPEEAYTLWQQAEQFYQQSQDQEGMLGSRINQVQALQSMGLYRKAYLQLTEIQEQVSILPDSPLKITGLKSLGDIFQITGNLEKARDLLQESVELGAQIGDPDTISAAWLSLGNVYQRLNDYDTSIEAYSRAALMASSSISKTIALGNELSLLIKTESWDLVDKRLPILTHLVSELEPSRMSVYAQVNLATNLQALLPQNTLSKSVPISSPDAIAQLLSKAVRYAQTIDDKRAESYALGQLGAIYEYTQQFDYALQLTNQALRLSKGLNAKDIDYRWQWQKGRILKAQSKSTEGKQHDTLATKAVTAYRQSVDTLKLIRADLLSADASIQFSFRDNVEPVYRELVDLLVTEDVSEIDLQLARQVIEDLQLAELQNFFRSACLDIEAQHIDQIDPTAAIIYPVILPDRLLVITSIPGRPLRQYSIPITELSVNQTVIEFLQTLNPAFSKADRLKMSQVLDQWLVAPLRASFHEQHVETLVFVLDGPLKNIPIAALYNGEQYLIEEFNVALTPGLQLMPLQESAEDQPHILAGAITEAHQGFEALPGVAQEVEAIATNFPTSLFLNEHFTADNLQREVNRNDFPILHLATHGQFSSDLDQTFLLGWEKTLKIQDFQLLVREHLPYIRQPIELLVLSACQTAEGDDRAALGLAGFAVRSGARSTLATLWSVNDQSTAALISEFYNQLAQHDNISKAEALRQAQIKLLADDQYSHPFYWAPFVLIGNWL